MPVYADAESEMQRGRARRPRYRDEDGEPCIDVVAGGRDRVFDSRDPAPFRERDLDPSLVEYLRGASEDLSSHRRVRIVFWLTTPCDERELATALRAHFAYELERLLRQRRRQVRTGCIALAIAVLIVVASTSLAEVVSRLLAGSIGTALGEVIVISCWVVMWRPIEVLVYDWIPWRRDRRTVERLHAARIDVRGAWPSLA